MFTRALQFATALLVVAPTSLAAEVLRIGTSVPHNHYLTSAIREFADEVTARTEGELTFEIYDSGSLVSDQQLDEAVVNGTLDIGIVSASILAGTIPALNVFAVPFYFDTQEKLNNAVVPGTQIRTMLDDQIDDIGARALFWLPFGYITMVTRNHEVHTPADMEGLKIRTFGSTVSDFVTSVGAAPVVTSGGEQFLALQRGIVDGGLTGWSSIVDRRLYEVSDYVIATDHMYETHFALLNDRTWNGLTADQQAIFQKVATDLEARLMQRIAATNEKARQTLMEKMTVIDLTHEEIQAWKDATTPVRDIYLRRTGATGAEVLRAAEKIQ
ncbi:TRAP transporter substrate-binding protein [Falsirhodobacter halotolerans]|uniref:TRAP transporter substrate-binding protein n=1 Tax=Falsirhodobacter halotolerans TaxID=1146892 RepID=UPI001FD5E0E6|nr:TRAP transporter substrate-binding protein DctP [Falsirhodobacter halotolerans]MCJ8140961.1 TRAP transporter substrate-binding protein DctP [Falsirhodobacter halotolerans]